MVGHLNSTRIHVKWYREGARSRLWVHIIGLASKIAIVVIAYPIQERRLLTD